MNEPLELADAALVAALGAGAQEAEATCTIARRFSARARDREIDKVEQATGRGLTLRVFTGVPGGLSRSALATSDLTPDGIRAFARQTVDAARYVAPDPYAGLPDPAHGALDGASGFLTELAIDASDVRERPNDKKLDDALVIEREARAFDPRIDNSNGSFVGDTAATVALANSRGVRTSYRYTTASLAASPVGRDGDVKRTATYGTAARGWSGCESPATVAKRAAERIVRMFGAAPIPTQRISVIFEREIAALVLGDIFAALNAANVAIENSYLADRIGEKVGSDLVTIVDDGRLPAGMGTSPFDAEGVPTRRTIVFERGVLRTHLYDTYYARKLGTKTTGNASGGGIGPNNFFLEAGDGTLDDLIARTKRGILILGIIGFATESATGTYSRGASGVLIENGEPARPVDGVTISGNLVQMLADLSDKAGDIRFDAPIVSPSFKVEEMTVSGE